MPPAGDAQETAAWASPGNPIAPVQKAGYKVAQPHARPDEARTRGDYASLQPRAVALIHHEAAQVHGLAQQTLEGITPFSVMSGLLGGPQAGVMAVLYASFGMTVMTIAGSSVISVLCWRRRSRRHD